MNRSRSAVTGWLLLTPALLLLGGLVVFPILYNVWLSLFNKHAFLPVQQFVGLEHYRYFATDAEFWSSFRHGVVYAGATMVLQLGVGVPAALLLNEAFRGRNLLRGIVLSPDDEIRRHVITQIMCNAHLDARDVERRFGIDFAAYFATELQALREHERNGFLRLGDGTIAVTRVGRVFIRNIAMTFDKYLEDKTTEKTFSRTI